MHATMEKSVGKDLQKEFGDRFTRDRIEVDLYSHDMGEFPGFLEEIIRPHAEAVVRARDVSEVTSLIRHARRRGIPITPRAAATSGYGGAIPMNGGIILDLTLLKTVREIATDSPTATVEAGVIWNDLEKALRERGLALRTYPSSAPSSTVGGWVAEGGSGIGAFAYGQFAESLEGLEVVTPEGELLWVEGEDLGLFYAAEGITGIVTAARIKLREAGEEVPLLFSFTDHHRLDLFLQAIKDVPLYHLQAFNARLIEDKNRLAEEDGGESLPVSFLVLAVLENPSAETEQKLNETAVAQGGLRLPDGQARHEWEERFYPMRIRRLGPSLIPAEALVPLSGLAGTLAEAGRKLPDLGVEAVITSGRQAVLLGFIPADARTLSFSLEFAKSLHFIKIALKHGGSPYGTGLYFATRYAQRWGEEKTGNLRSYKAEHDPDNLLNPGKLLTGRGRPLRARLIDLMMYTAMPFAGIAGRLGALLPGQPLRKKGRLPQDIEDAAYTCAQCGYCVEKCSLYSGKGWDSASPRGKWYYLKRYNQGKLPLTQKMTDNFLLCTTCKKCDPVCQTNLAIESLWAEMRGELVASGKFHTFPPFEMMGAAYDMENNIWAGFARERDAWLPDYAGIKEGCGLAYWAGCTASYVEQDIARGAVRILTEGGIDFDYLGQQETCCGVPFLMSGKWDVFEQAVRRNIEAVNRRGIKTLVASCPGCWVTLAHTYKEWAEKLGLEWDVEVRHISEVAVELLHEGKLKFEKEVPLTVTWHDPCHIGRHGGIYEQPREVLAAIPGLTLVEMEHNREDGLCCGSVLTLIGDTYPTSGNIAEKRLAEARAAGADVLASTCPCCEFQLRVWSEGASDGMPVRDFASIVGEALGETLEDPTPQVMQSWAVFDKMIKMMSPAGMADFMEEFMGTLPGGGIALKAMRLLPRPLVDGMAWGVGKVMPKMAPAVLPPMLRWMLPRMFPIMEKRMPEMSDSMRALMPEMMPDVMMKVMPPLMGPMMQELLT
jgi:Fe-S oxidoreductase/FAD/FMN-containing dehydrogenase